MAKLKKEVVAKEATESKEPKEVKKAGSYNEKELKEIADNHRKTMEGAPSVIYLTEDGQVFYEEGHAKNHAGQKGLRVFENKSK